jgi:spore coat protein CotF
MQHNIYGLMEQKGWYTVNAAPVQQITEVKTKFQNA